MRDVVFVATIVAFFLLAVAYVAWCDRIVGPDETADGAAPGADAAEAAGASPAAPAAPGSLR